MAMCRIVEALEVELKALSLPFLTDPPPPPPRAQGSRSVLQRWLFMLYGTTGATTEGWKEVRSYYFL